MISFSVTQHQNLEVNFLRFSRIWPIINSMLHRCPIKLVQCQRDSTVLVNTFLLVSTIFFFSRIMYAIKVLLPRAKTKMFNAEFAFILSSDSGKMSVHACKFLQAQRNGTDNISFVTLLRENGDFFKIPIVCFNFARIRLNRNR